MKTRDSKLYYLSVLLLIVKNTSNTLTNYKHSWWSTLADPFFANWVLFGLSLHVSQHAVVYQVCIHSFTPFSRHHFSVKTKAQDENCTLTCLNLLQLWCWSSYCVFKILFLKDTVLAPCQWCLSMWMYVWYLRGTFQVHQHLFESCLYSQLLVIKSFCSMHRIFYFFASDYISA